MDAVNFTTLHSYAARELTFDKLWTTPDNNSLLIWTTHNGIVKYNIHGRRFGPLDDAWNNFWDKNKELMSVAVGTIND
jgi:hypothetical protein